MAGNMGLNKLSLAREVEVVDLTGDATDDEQSVTFGPSSSGYLAETDSDHTIVGGSKKIFTGGYDTANEEQSVPFDPSSSGYLAESDSDQTVVGGCSKKVFTGGYDTDDDKQSEASSGYVTEEIPEHLIARARKEVVPGDYDIGKHEGTPNQGFQDDYYSEYEEHMDGELTNEEIDKKYPGTHALSYFLFSLVLPAIHSMFLPIDQKQRLTG